VPVLVRRNIRALGGQGALLSPVLTVTQIELICWVDRTGKPQEYELYCLEDGTRRRPDELVFVEVDEELRLAMRMEAAILAKDKKK
jgi:hypothetical protein